MTSSRRKPGPPATRAGLALCAAFLAACSAEPATIIDGSTEQCFEQTTAAARRELSIADRLEFDRALAGIPARRYADHDPTALRRRTFDGMTAAEVVAEQRARERLP
jgi:hypothetical protein